uniref:PA protein n=1 Tax=Thogotovirus dhoriense TaxID=11318 RepID=A0A7M1I6R2_9ORTO|nr:PA protein [Thogotovirus dhoriense]
MDRHKPKTISPEIWALSETSKEWMSNLRPLEARIVECIKYTVCCHISDMHLYNGVPRYIVNMWTPHEVADQEMKRQNLIFARPNVPDLLDLKERKGVYVKVYPDNGVPTDYQTAENEIFVRVSLNGQMSPITREYLDEVQRQDVTNFLVTMYNESLESNLLERLQELYDTDPVPFAVPAEIIGMLTGATDLGLIPDITPASSKPPKTRGDKWSQMKTLPKLKIPEGPPAKWGAWLLGHESRYKIFDEGSDQSITARFLADYSDFVCLRESKATPKQTCESVLSSLRAYSEGRPKRSRITEDIRSFGIGIKKRKRQEEEIVLKNSEDLWTRASFPVEENSEPSWIKEELEELERPTDIRWLSIEPNYTHTIVDAHAKEAVDQFNSIVDSLWASALVEKMQIAATRAYNELHSDRARITTVPVITRKEWHGTVFSQLWGFVIIGPHHIKQETDRIPIITVELVDQDNPEKYPNHSFVRFLYNKDTESVGHEDLLIRVTSIAKYRLFTFSTIRRVYIQPCSVYSKLILNQSAEAREKDFSMDKKIEVYLEGRPVALSWKSWLIKVFCLEYIMAIHNNPQMEGFLANIRRLHMARHAMMEKAGVYIPHGSAPEEKCNECVINNPIVAYLARTWNELPNVYM